MENNKANKKWSIDRSKKNVRSKSKVLEKIPETVAQMVVTEVLSRVGDSDWNDPREVSKTIAYIMGIDLEKDVTEQEPGAVDVDRTVLIPSRKDATVPYWICQSLIRVDEKNGNRFIDYKGSKYNKIDIIYGSEFFRKSMDRVADHAGCTWNARWGNSKVEKHRLYQKTRSGDEESWLEKCIKPLLTENDENGINIKDLVMVEFKRKSK